VTDARKARITLPCHAIQRVAARLPGGGRWSANLLARIGARDPRIYMISETRWATWWVGHYLHKYLHSRYPVRHTTATGTFAGCRVHYTSPHLFFGHLESIHPSADVVVSWWHGSRRTPGLGDRTLRLPETSKRFRWMVTSCRLVEEDLLSYGVLREKLVRIPLGVDTSIFVPPSEEERRAARRKWGVPEGVFCVGSFQRDGEEEPKWVKGPEVLVRAAEIVSRNTPVFFFLSGGARGWVKGEFDRLGIEYVHHELEETEFHVMRELYWAIDAHVIPSREEGAPLSLLEAAASKVPVAATRCGLCPELIRDRENGVLVDLDDAEGLAEGILWLAEDEARRRDAAEKAFADVGRYDWKVIAEEYEREIYGKWV
jgi:glycosyltransferase involved in cell wall biosynthesis